MLLLYQKSFEVTRIEPNVNTEDDIPMRGVSTTLIFYKDKFNRISGTESPCLSLHLRNFDSRFGI